MSFLVDDEEDQQQDQGWDFGGLQKPIPAPTVAAPAAGADTSWDFGGLKKAAASAQVVAAPVKPRSYASMADALHAPAPTSVPSDLVPGGFGFAGKQPIAPAQPLSGPSATGPSIDQIREVKKAGQPIESILPDASPLAGDAARLAAPPPTPTAPAESPFAHARRVALDTAVASSPILPGMLAIPKAASAVTGAVRAIPTAVGETLAGQDMPGHEGEAGPPSEVPGFAGRMLSTVQPITDLYQRLKSHALMILSGNSGAVAPIGVVGAMTNPPDTVQMPSDAEQAHRAQLGLPPSTPAARGKGEMVGLEVGRRGLDMVAQLLTDPVAVASMGIHGVAGDLLAASFSVNGVQQAASVASDPRATPEDVATAVLGAAVQTLPLAARPAVEGALNIGDAALAKAGETARAAILATKLRTPNVGRAFHSTSEAGIHAPIAAMERGAGDAVPQVGETLSEAIGTARAPEPPPIHYNEGRDRSTPTTPQVEPRPPQGPTTSPPEAVRPGVSESVGPVAPSPEPSPDAAAVAPPPSAGPEFAPVGAEGEWDLSGLDRRSGARVNTPDEDARYREMREKIAKGEPTGSPEARAAFEERQRVEAARKGAEWDTTGLTDHDGKPIIDTLDTGEAQPRLPGDVGAVREREVPTPKEEIPFSLTPETAKRTEAQPTLREEPPAASTPEPEVPRTSSVRAFSKGYDNPNLHERRELGRMLKEMQNIEFTPRTRTVLDTMAKGKDELWAPGAAGAEVFSDIKGANRGAVINAIQRVLDGKKPTAIGQRAIDVARKRLDGSGHVSGAMLPPDAGNEPGRAYVETTHDMTPEEAAVEKNFRTAVEERTPKVIRAYRKRFGNVISADNAKELSREYAENPAQFHRAVHRGSSALADAVFRQMISEPPPQGKLPEVAFLAGPTGVGKSTVFEDPTYGPLFKDAQVVVDGPLTTMHNAQVRIEAALDAGKKVSILYVHQDPTTAWQGVVERGAKIGRQPALDYHIKSHVGGLDTIHQLADRYAGDPRVSVEYVGNPRHGTPNLIQRSALPKAYNEEDVRSAIEAAGHAAPAGPAETVAVPAEVARSARGSDEESSRTRSEVRPAEEVAPPKAPRQSATPVSEPPREFSSTQVELPADVAGDIRTLADSIPDADLGEDGREDKPHVTVKFGLHTDDVADVRRVLAGEGPITVTLGKTSLFPAKEGADYDVVKVDVDSPDLHRLNAKIAKALEHTDTHPTYKPHATIAYVKAGLGKKYEGRTDLEGKTVTLNAITFSGKNRELVSIPLTGKPRVAQSSTSAPRGKRPVVRAYHGTNRRFDAFGLQPAYRNIDGRPQEVQAQAHFFSTDRGSAQRFAEDRAKIDQRLRGREPGTPHVREVSLSVRRPLDLTVSDSVRARMTRDGYSTHYNPDGISPYGIDALQRIAGVDVESWDDVHAALDDADVVTALREEGYDAVRLRENDGSETWAVFDAGQIASGPNKIAQSSTSAPGRGGTTLQASIIPGAKELIDQDVTPAVKAAAEQANKARKDIRVLFAPDTVGDASRLFADVMRAGLAGHAQRIQRAQRSLRKLEKAFDKRSDADNLAFIDAIEGGAIEDLPPAERAAAQQLRDLLDVKRAEVRKRGKLQTYIDNYFPHEWKQPTKAKDLIRQILGKRPLQGPKSFLKQRKIPTVKEGIAAGLEPASYNPVTLVLHKLAEMDKWMMAHDVLKDAKALGVARFIRAGAEAPEGWQRYHESFGTVYAPPFVKVEEAFDARLMEKLHDFATSLGITTVRKVKIAQKGSGIGGNAWGYAMAGPDGSNPKVATKFAGPETVLEHEIGHILDWKYGLWDKIKKELDEERFDNQETHPAQELRDLADLRFEGQEPKPSFKAYVRKKEEKIANLVHAFIYNPTLAKDVAPNAYWALYNLAKDTPALRPLIELQKTKSLVLGTNTTEQRVNGMVIGGHYYGPPDAVRILNNHLSPGLRGNATFDAYRTIGNFMNQVQLGLSGFHLTMTGIEAMVSKLAQGFEELSRGEGLHAAKSLAEAPVATFTTLYKGNKALKALYAKDANMRTFADVTDIVVQGGGGVHRDQTLKVFDDRMESLMRALRQGNVLGAAMRAPLAAIELPTKFIMEWWVPRLKLGAYLDMARMELRTLGEEPSLTDVRRVLGGVQDSIDNRFGQLIYDNLFWKNSLKDLGMGAFRALGWNTGTAREVFGAPSGQLGHLIKRPTRLRDTGERTEEGRPVYTRENDPWLTHKGAYVMALTFGVGMMGALYQYLHTGERPKELRDYFFPRTGRKRPDGKDERVSFPSYFKDVYSVGHDLPGSALTTLGHKLAPLLNLLYEITTNEDFYGTEIRNTTDPMAEQAKDLFLAAARSFVPFPVQSFIERKQDRGGTGTSVLESFFGVTPAPASVYKSKAEDLMQSFMPPVHRTKAQAEAARARRSLRDAFRTKDQDEARDVLSQGILTSRQVKNAAKMSEQSTLQSGFSHLTLEQALSVYEVATEEERSAVRGMLAKKAERLMDAPAADRADLLRRLKLAFGQPASGQIPVTPRAGSR